MGMAPGETWLMIQWDRCLSDGWEDHYISGFRKLFGNDMTFGDILAEYLGRTEHELGRFDSAGR